MLTKVSLLRAGAFWCAEPFSPAARLRVVCNGVQRTLVLSRWPLAAVASLSAVCTPGGCHRESGGGVPSGMSAAFQLASG